MAGGFEIRERLRSMDWRQFVNRFQLNDQTITRQNVQPAFANSAPFVPQRHARLTDVGYSAQSKLDTERLFVCAFPIPRPQYSMHLDCRTNHRVRKPIHFFW